MSDNMILHPGHPILDVGDLVHYDATFAGDLPAKIVGTVRAHEHGRDVVKVRLMLTIRTARSGYRPRELITVQAREVLPRKGWRTLNNPFHKRHTLGWCLAWEPCSQCGHEPSRPEPQRR